MIPVPTELNGASVVAVALMASAASTGGTIHRVNNEIMEPADALAICTYPDQSGFYLFYCDSSWQVITDTWHQTVDDAKAQAEFEYAGASSLWKNAI